MQGLSPSKNIFLKVNTIFRPISGRLLSSFQVIINEYGNPNDVLEGVTLDLPKISPNQMLLKMLMSPINPSDINMIEGTYHIIIKPELPTVAGNEGVGEILEVGSEVTQHSIGDKVIYSIADRCSSPHGAGTWRQYALLQPENVLPVPSDLPIVSAATLAVNPCTAYRMLKDFVNLSPGDVIIQNGANSVVGQFVIQLARHWGVQTINLVRERPDKEVLVDYLKQLGADFVLTDEQRKTGELKELLKVLGTKPKLAFNCVGGETSAHLVTSLANGGTVVTYGGMSRRPVMVPTGSLIFNQIQAVGYWNTAWMKQHNKTKEQSSMIEELSDLITKGVIQTPEADLFDIKDFKAAVKESHLDGFKGNKKVLVMDKTLISS